jgi:mRNA interferase MazF
MSMTQSGIACKQREIILIPFPFSDVSASKKRPALVISHDGFNVKNDDVIVCMITSNPDEHPNDIMLSEEDLEMGSLEWTSRIKPYRLFSVDKRKIVQKIGVLKHVKASEVTQKILELIKV